MAEKRVKLNTGEVGAIGLKRSVGFIHEEFLAELSGIRGVDVFKQMSNNDAVVGALLFAIKMLISQVPWHAQRVSDNQVDIDAADFLAWNMHHMEQSWYETISEILSFLVFGWALVEEVIMRRDDNRIVWKKLPLRAQDTLLDWVYEDDTDHLIAMKQNPPPTYRTREVPLNISMLFRADHYKNNPEGRSILRTAYRDWYFKTHTENIEGIGLERDLAGIPVAKIPGRILNSDKITDKAIVSRVEDILKKIKNNEEAYILTSSDVDKETKVPKYEFSLLGTAGRRLFDTTKIIDRRSKATAMSVLADFLFLGQGEKGSHALASSKTKLFSTAIGSWLDSIAGVFNRGGIPRLFEKNVFPGIKELPELKHGDIETPDLEILGKFIGTLAAAGIQFSEEDEQTLKNLAGLKVKNV